MRIHQTGLLDWDRDRATPGFTVIAPSGAADVYLIDMAGDVVHTWKTPLRAGGPAKPMAGGNLLIRDWPDADAPRGLEEMKYIREYDWDSNVVWECEAPAMHHDHRKLANGNIIFIGFRRLSEAGKARVKGGIPGSEQSDGSILGDYIREVNPAGETVWEWFVEDDMEIEKFPLPPLSGREQFSHANALDVLPNGDIIVSFRYSSWLFIIDKATKKVRWEMMSPLWGGQHDCQWLENGNILFFANGHHRPSFHDGKRVGAGIPQSRVIELNPETREEEWSYQGDPPWYFYSQHASGCQRLWSGNTLICETEKGCVFEVTPENDVVWEYVSPYRVQTNSGFGNDLFRATRHAPDSPEIDGRVSL